MLVIHHLKNSRSHRVLWLLEELGQPYEVVIHNEATAAQTLKEIHPLGKAPILCDDDLVMAETSAIVETLLDRVENGHLQPPCGSRARDHYVYWRQLSEGTLMPYLVKKLMFARIESNAPLLVRPLVKAITKSVNQQYLNPNLDVVVGLAESHLARHQWFAGDQFSAADIMMAFPLEVIAGRLEGADTCPRIREFTCRVRQRPAYQRALAKGQGSIDQFEEFWSGIGAIGAA